MHCSGDITWTLAVPTTELLLEASWKDGASVARLPLILDLFIPFYNFQFRPQALTFCRCSFRCKEKPFNAVYWLLLMIGRDLTFTALWSEPIEPLQWSIKVRTTEKVWRVGGSFPSWKTHQCLDGSQSPARAVVGPVGPKPMVICSVLWFEEKARPCFHSFTQPPPPLPRTAPTPATAARTVAQQQQPTTATTTTATFH